MRAPATLRKLIAFAIFCVAGSAVAAVELKVATLNCHRLFVPGKSSRGKNGEHAALSPSEFEQKLSNLSSLMAGYDVVAVQETGGQEEISALAARAGMLGLWGPGPGKNASGDVGLIYRLPGWNVRSRGRIEELDRVISRHLLVEATGNSQRVLFLVLQLARPAGRQIAQHKRQLAAVGEWMSAESAADPNAVIVVLGDANTGKAQSCTSIFGVGIEAGDEIGFQATHLSGQPLDRIVLLGPGRWRNVEVRGPPYGDHPEAALKRVWTDHFLIGAELRTAR